MKKILFICLIAFSLCSCNTEKKKMESAVIDYVSYLTYGGDFTITDLDYYEHLTITNYEDYKTELEETIKECDERIESYKEHLTYSLYSQSFFPTKMGQENIDLTTSEMETYMKIRARAKTELSLTTNKDNFTPKYTYHCEYKFKGMKNSIWVLLEYDDYKNEYKVHLLTGGYFNMEP